MHSGIVTKTNPSLLPTLPILSKDEGLKNIGHSMSIRSLNFGFNSITISDLICYDSLLQNATDFITKYDSYFIIKRDRSLLQNVSDFLYKIRQFY